MRLHCIFVLIIATLVIENARSDCVDIISSTKCNKSKKIGKCKLNWTQKNCQKTCGLCPEPRTMEAPTAIETEPTEPTASTASTTTMELSTTKAPTTTQEPTTIEAPEDDEQVNCDVGFVMDVAGSESFGPVERRGAYDWDIQKDFVLRLANRSGISESGAHVAVTTFSSECPTDCVADCPNGCPNDRPNAELMIRFNDYTNFSSFELALTHLPNGGLGHLIDKGMGVALYNMFKKENGMRPSSPKTMVLITDGHQSGADYADWGKLFDDANIRTIVVGIGKDVADNQIDFKRLVQDENDLHLVSSFSFLVNDSLVNNISLCEDPKLEECFECTKWFNSDDCTNDGDWEIISDVTGISESVIECPFSYMIQAKTKNTIMYSSEHVLAVTGNRVVFNYKPYNESLTGAGLICDNRNNTEYNDGPEQKCEDYSVWFCCSEKNEIIEKNSNVDVAFMMDATGSMGSYIRIVKDGINNIVARVHRKFKAAIVRVAFVAYRDYEDGAKHFEILDFTDNITLFTDFVGRITATGGGDTPEDVLGAIDQTINLNWKAANKIFYQTGDSPPRGFCNPPSTCSPNGNDIAGPQASDLFAQIDDKCLKYNVMQINRRQDYMVHRFKMIAKSHDGDERFHVYDMTDGTLNFNTVGDSILESIELQLKATNDYLNNPGSMPNRCIEL